jgi:hypothetical protein
MVVPAEPISRTSPARAPRSLPSRGPHLLPGWTSATRYQPGSSASPDPAARPDVSPAPAGPQSDVGRHE